MSAPFAALRSRLPPSLSGYAKRCFTIDTRSLALIRILAGMLILADLLSRSRNFHFYYTDDGVVTQELAETYTSDFAVSVFFLTSDPRVIAGLFVLHGILALALIAGYKTRVATALSFLFVISLDHHNPLVLSYADTLFRMLLFWALFLPLGERWSIDAIQRERTPRPAIATLATAAFMIQMVFMYSVNGLNKWPSELWHSGEAAIIVFGIDEMTFFLGNVMRNFPTLIQIGGRTWFYLLIASPLLILLYGRARYPMMLLLVGGHASFAITVRIGAFPYVAIMGLLAFLQPVFWRDVRRLLEHRDLRGASVGVHRGARDHVGQPLASALPARLVDFRERDLFVQKTLTVAVAVAMVGLFLLPGATMLEQGPVYDASPLPSDNPIEDTVAEWGVGQPEWSIFANPGPRSVDRYYVFPAKTADGDVFDVYNERPLTYDRPGDELQRQHDAYRKRFYMNSIRRAGPHGRAPALYADHLCDYWAEERGVELTHIHMWEVREPITVETFDDPDARERSEHFIARHTCGGGPPEDFGEPPA